MSTGKIGKGHASVIGGIGRKNEGEKKPRQQKKFGAGIPGPGETGLEIEQEAAEAPEKEMVESVAENQESQAKDEQPPQPELEKEKDHPHVADDQALPDLVKFEEDIKEYFEQLNWRPKSELVTNVPVPLPNPVYQKIKELEPYFTRKQKGFLQEVITRAVIEEVKRMIVEVKTNNLKKKRKK